MTETNYTPEMLAQLERDYASGILESRYEGKAVVFRSREDMERTIIRLRKALTKQEGKKGKSQRVHLRSNRGI